MKNKKNVYIIYNFNEFENDFQYVAEYYDLKTLQKENNILLGNEKSIYYFIQDEIKETKNKLLNDKYLIIKESL